MTSSHLEDLPNELLRYICEHVEGRRGSLTAFSLASKTCYAVALPSLFRRIKIIIKDTPLGCTNHTTSDWKGYIWEWQSLLDRRHAYGQVRLITVSQQHVAESWEGPSEPHHLDLVRADDELQESPVEGSLNPETYRRDCEHTKACWEQLRTLVDKIPFLAELVWETSWPLPIDIRHAFERLPSLRLCLPSFWWRDYVSLESVEAQDLGPACDPHLYGVATRSFGYGDVGGPDYTHEALLALVTGINPYIRCASFLTVIVPTAFGLSFLNDGTKRPVWSGFPSSSANISVSAALRSLEIGGSVFVELDLFQDVFRKCNLTELRVLKLRVPYTYRGLSVVNSTTSLPRLEVLLLGSKWTSFPGEDLHHASLAGEFLAALRPLRAIRFINEIDEDIFRSTLQQHGDSLRRLWFEPPVECNKIFFTPGRVAELRRECPSLEDLAINVPRSRGDAAEVQMYRELGQLSRLSRLALTLDCEDTTLDLCAENFDPTPIYPDFNHEDAEFLTTTLNLRSGDQGREARKGHLRHAMMNAALDRSLAKHIYRTIAESKPGFDTDLQLQRLELRPIRGIYTPESADAINDLSKWWLVENFGFASGISEPTMTRIRSHGDRDEECWGPPPLTLECGLESVFRMIWPERRRPELGWSGDWHSLPLQT